MANGIPLALQDLYQQLEDADIEATQRNPLDKQVHGSRNRSGVERSKLVMPWDRALTLSTSANANSDSDHSKLKPQKPCQSNSRSTKNKPTVSDPTQPKSMTVDQKSSLISTKHKQPRTRRNT